MDAQAWRDMASVYRMGEIQSGVTFRPALSAMADRCERIAAEREQAQREHFAPHADGPRHPVGFSDELPG